MEQRSEPQPQRTARRSSLREQGTELDKIGEGPMWAPPPTIVSGELEDEGPVASQSGRGMQISKRGSALRRLQSTVLPPSASSDRSG